MKFFLQILYILLLSCEIQPFLFPPPIATSRIGSTKLQRPSLPQSRNPRPPLYISDSSSSSREQEAESIPDSVEESEISNETTLLTSSEVAMPYGATGSFFPNFNASEYALSALSNFSDAIDDFSKRISHGSTELIANVSSAIEHALQTELPASSARELSEHISGITRKNQEAQEQDLLRRLEELERRFVEPLEQFAFSDAPLFQARPTTVPRELLILAGKNSTLTRSARRKTSELLQNFNVAPLYYSVALLYRWARKVSMPSIWLLSTFMNLASLVRTKGTPRFQQKQRSEQTQEDRIQDAEAMHSGWQRIGQIASKGPLARKWAILRRSAEVWSYFSSFYLKDRRISRNEQSGRWSEERVKAERSKLGVEITQNLLRLGPTFIKFGQLLSTRVDVVPKEYIDELKVLQDNVPTFSGDIAQAIIERELGKPINQIFDTFDKKAIAGASLGQVHIATRGDQVFAVKVQRQHLKELFEVDLGQLRQLAVFADALDVSSEGGLLDRNTQRDWLSIFEENKRLLYEEIDYRNEQRNAERFRKNFEGPKFQHIRIPKTYAEYSTEKVLCMEYVPGVKITDLEKIHELGLDPVDISVKSAQAFFEQICRHGYFHCDPHPGNISVERGPDGKARLIFYDFGMMDSFGPEQRKGFVDLAFAVYYDANVKDACDALERMGMLRNDANMDRVAVERVGQDFIDRFQETLSTNAKWEFDLPAEEQKRLARERRKKLGDEFLSLNRDSPFILPPTWTFVIRALFSLDGIGKTLDPNFDTTKIMLPYLKELLDLKDGSIFKTTLSRIGKRLGLRPVDFYDMLRQPRRTANINDIVTRLERGDLVLRVRALQVERQNERSKLVLQNSFEAIILGLFLQSGVGILTLGAGFRGSGVICRLFFGGASCLAARIPWNLWRLRQLDKYNEHYGKAS